MTTIQVSLTLPQLEKLTDVLLCTTDCGPGNEGWPSPELRELRDLFEAALAKANADQNP